METVFTNSKDAGQYVSYTLEIKLKEKTKHIAKYEGLIWKN